MVSKAFVVLCVSAICIQAISAQCIGNVGALAAEEILSNGALSYNSGAPLLGAPLTYAAPNLANYGINFTPSSGGAFAVTSSSPISPTGIRVISENAIEGALSVIGELPFLSAVAFESALPSAGAGAINYGCGSGAVGIVSETLAPIAAAYGPVGPAYGGLNNGLNGRLGLGGLAANGIAANNLATNNLAGLGLGLNAAGLAAPGLAVNNLGAAGLAGAAYNAGLAPGLGYNGLAGYGYGPL